MSCGDCRHYFGVSDKAGQCRRYPPQAGGVVPVDTLTGPQNGVLWSVPQVGITYSCGEFSAVAVKVALAS